MALMLAKFQRSSTERTFSYVGSKKAGVGKMCVFQPTSSRISETVRDRAKVANDH